MLPKPNTKPTISVEVRKKIWEAKIEEKIKERRALNFIEVDSILYRLVLLFFTALCVFLCFVWVHFDFHFWLGVLFFAIAIPTGLVLFASICADLCWLNRKKYKADKQKDAKLKEEIQKLRDKLSDEALEEENRRIEAANVEMWKSYQRDLSVFKQEQQKAITALDNGILFAAREITPIYEQLKIASTDLLDERDWQHLDIVIYMMETGRADTIKEALQQADLYIRHNEIRHMLATATTAICATIQENISTLSHAIDTRLREIQSTLADTNQAQREISAGIQRLIGTQELNNALLQKSNVSSERLVKELAELRKLQTR